MITLDEMRQMTPWALAAYADCGSPDTLESPGARFLLSVRDDLVERLEYERSGDDNCTQTWAEAGASLAGNGGLGEIADNAPDVYTHRRWLEFVDLAAWQEDPAELGATEQDMTQQAGVCLYLIADRLVQALVAELPGDEDEPDDDDETAERQARGEAAAADE